MFCFFSPLYLGGPNIFVYSRGDNFARHAFWSCTGRVLDYLFVSDDTLSKYRSRCCFFVVFLQKDALFSLFRIEKGIILGKNRADAAS